MGGKKKMNKKPIKEAKPKTDSKLMLEVEKSNPEFVNWLRRKKLGK